MYSKTVILKIDIYIGPPGWNSNINKREIIDNDHLVLDYKFSNGFGGPECPRFIAM